VETWLGHSEFRSDKLKHIGQFLADNQAHFA